MVIVSFGHVSQFENMPATFIDHMNRLFLTQLDFFFVIFIDNILIYLRNKEDHASHLKIILQTLNDRELYANFSKCEFGLSV